MTMKTPHLILLYAWLCVCPAAHAYDVPGFTPDQVIAYKQTVNSSGAAVELNLEVFTPPGKGPGLWPMGKKVQRLIIRNAHDIATAAVLDSRMLRQ